ncbi:MULTISPECIES: type I-F CRISPR-associated protein Csy3 [unclassified Avibacterium]|uniref:type I-F CRISPR-associated protein Csy3 n=1 Tax=unclassified Avibacterium TaxID=2685287 RepID=UPI0020275698|nr:MULTISPECIES: type I-F CRISPR-associated protein Csy3 [unclassified Avibacterium]MCW9699074.1 type I-F CRISPR-associated protein Csy3 [Avibacterium sp. 20-129]URL06731.1 type I-F CRISPR-associated protein Csy3 [Avibacterium sp. 21-595]
MAKINSKVTVLAFERKIDISDAYLWQTNSQKENALKEPVIVREKSVRGTISNRLKNAIASNPAKLDAEIEKANLQRVDAAFLNEDCDTLIASFTCKILPFTGKPSVCNNQDFQAALEETVAQYKQEQGFAELAKRYAINLINARWLWRNRIGAESITVTIKNGEDTLTFNQARDISLNDFDFESPDLTKLAAWIEAGFNGKAFTLLQVEAQANIGNGQEVFPSQELVLDTGKNKSKILYTVGREQNQAGIHSQKIGNAIRTIDNWYPNAAFPIAAEPYGAVTTLGTAYRQPKDKQDFYSLFDPWIKEGKAPKKDEQHYVIAILIRGGVFGESGKE